MAIGVDAVGRGEYLSFDLGVKLRGQLWRESQATRCLKNSSMLRSNGSLNRSLNR
jgi:hypothetical protein